MRATGAGAKLSAAQVEQLVEAVLNRSCSPAPDPAPADVRSVLDFDCSKRRVVVFGGGTGLSTVVGGNSQLAAWPDNPAVGLKCIFPQMDVIVCATDDGRSTGELLKHLPMIGIGDLRKLCLSTILPSLLEATYGIDPQESAGLIRLIHTIFNHRFPKGSQSCRMMCNPLLAAPSALRKYAPESLAASLGELGAYFTPAGPGPTIPPREQCLGNLLLTASIFMETGGNVQQPPGMQAVRAGLDRVARAIGAPPGRIHPATAAPGQLIFRYAHGVEVRGQSKSGAVRRGFPVDRIQTEFISPPDIAPDVTRLVREADLIILAPGSLYTSIIPILQVRALADAIRANQKALKILGANFWVEEGETDITRAERNRGFRVSELIQAYDHNIEGGCTGLFDMVLTANLDHFPGSILRNYALEGKRPIYLDRPRVEALGFQPVESTVFSLEKLKLTGFIHHDPENFARAVQTLLYAHNTSINRKNKSAPARRSTRNTTFRRAESPLCVQWKTANNILSRKSFHHATLRQLMADILWENRDIRAEHLAYFDGVRVLRDPQWHRSTEWDNVLGYYDRGDRLIKIHQDLLDSPERLKGNLLIALGESLLGRYTASTNWLTPDQIHNWGARCYEIQLRPPGERRCYLPPSRLHDYLVLARMTPHPTRSGIYRITLNNPEGFLPPGLLFGLLFAWYLNNAYGAILENEMTLLHRPETTLIPHQVEEYRRAKALIHFFRKEVFGYEGD